MVVAMYKPIRIFLLLLMAAISPALCADAITIAAAADLKFAMDQIIADFMQDNADASVEVVYGSSGTFNAQITQGAPFDLYFSADISYPRELEAAGWAASPVRPYAIGRIVLWSSSVDASTLALSDLTEARFRRIAIANPRHAPYGKRAEEALRAAGVWEQIKPKLVYGENIAQTAQFVQTGNADIGIIALSLALSPEFAANGGYWLIPDTLHQPLEQGYIVTSRAKDSVLASRFADFMESVAARSILSRYGFILPVTDATGSAAE